MGGLSVCISGGLSRDALFSVARSLAAGYRRWFLHATLWASLYPISALYSVFSSLPFSIPPFLSLYSFCRLKSVHGAESCKFLTLTLIPVPKISILSWSLSRIWILSTLKLKYCTEFCFSGRKFLERLKLGAPLSYRAAWVLLVLRSNFFELYIVQQQHDGFVIIYRHVFL